MDPYAPINGISLERYAELSADVADTQDLEKQAEIVAHKGVSRQDWEAAKSGWTARMQDMSLMGAVATRFMPLYQAELAKRSPAGSADVSFDDYVAMSGAAAAIGYEGMLAHYKVTQAQWTQIAGKWNQAIPTSPQYMQYGMLVQNEAARIRAGGAPKPVGAGGAAPAPPAAPPAHAAYPAQAAYAAPAAQPMAHPGYPPQQHPGYAPQQYAQANPFGTPQQQQSFDRQLDHGFNQIGGALASFGNAVGGAIDGTLGTYSPGARVLVQWSDGNRYPATVVMAQSGQVEVAFPDGRRMWIPAHAVTPG